MKQPSRAESVLLSVTAVGAATAISRLGNFNPPTAGFVFLMVVLVSATFGGLAAGVTASILSTVAFNYFFFPPVGTFHVEHAENWLALGAFLAVSTVASQLVTRAREEARRARARATEVQTLYDLSVELFLAASSAEELARATAAALVATGARRGAVALFDGPGEERWFGTIESPSDETVRERVRSIRIHRQTLEFPSEGGRDLYVPIGAEEPTGVLLALDTSATRAAVESIARLLSLAIEREQLLSQRAHVEALKESESMRTALLRAVSHDLSTPLTAMTVQVASLQRQLAGQPTAQTALLLGEEVARLKRRIDNLLAMARLETGSIEPRPEPIPPADLFRAARENLGTAGGPFTVRVRPDTPDAFADPSLALEILVNLVENARRASPPGATVELAAEPDPEDPATVRLGVLDRGRGMERPGDAPRGLGLEIARRFAEASAGTVAFERRSGGGTAAWLRLPASTVRGGAIAGAAHSRR